MINKISDSVDFSSYLSPARAEIVRKRNPPELILADMTMTGEQSFVLIKLKQ